MSLRDRQKRDRERRIMCAAVTMFRERAYKDVRMEDLAARSDLSVGTLYNYYRTKGDLLIAAVAMEVEDVLALGARIVENPSEDAETAILSLVFCYYDHSLQYLSKEMWRTAMALSIEAPDTPNGRRYADLDARLSDQCCQLLRVLKRRGQIQPEIPAEDLGALLFNALNMIFVDFVRRDDEAIETLRRRATAQLSPLARLMTGNA